MIRNLRRYVELREGEDLARLRAMTPEDSIAIGEDLLRSELMRFVRPDESRPMSLAIAFDPKRRKAGLRLPEP